MKLRFRESLAVDQISVIYAGLRQCCFYFNMKEKMFRGIDNDEAAFLEFASKQQAEIDSRRFAVTAEVKEFRVSFLDGPGRARPHCLCYL